MKCTSCKFDYPEGILSQMMINNTYTKLICGICALEKSNEGLPKKLRRKRFNGEQAEYYRQMALEYRKKL